ncbi:MAG: polyvinyl-alcohol dehydrogenase, partial [Bryobacterales bacterium]|nr:polyvinyl-alcohol dehydrogenase [Bryobacterales bacterium]
MRLLVYLLLAVTVSAQDGAAIYEKHCSACHDKGVGRAPLRDALKRISPESVLAALTNGTMTAQARALTTAEIRSVSAFITGKSFGSEGMPEQAFCAGRSAAFDNPLAGPYWNGWGVNLMNQRSQPPSMAGLNADQTTRLKLKWAFGLPGVIRAFAQPAVAGGRIFVGTEARKVYSLDAASGCVHWVFDAEAGVRSAISIGRAGTRWAAYFGDQKAYAYAVDAGTGKLLWKTRVDEFPAAVVTGAPTLHEGRLYVPVSSWEEVTGSSPDYECCKFRGSVTALDAATGTQIWKSYTIPEAPRPIRKNKKGTQLWGPSGAAVWSSPTLDLKRRALYVATGDAYSDPAARTSDAFVAFDMDSGKMLWSRQMTTGDAFNLACGSPLNANCPEAKGPDFDFGSSPILVNLANGKRALVAGQKSGLVHAVDPDQQGEVLWQTRVGQGGALGGVQWGSAVDDQNIYVALSDVRTMFTAGPGAHKTVMGGYAEMDPKAGGGLFALKLATGERVWHAPPPGCGEKRGCSPAQSAAVTLISRIVFSGALDGHLRAYSTSDGRIVWDVDTAKDFETVNGVKASGGSIDGPGPVVVGGML